MDNSFFNKKAWMALISAIILVIAGELVLAWQYNRLETDRLPRIEQELAERNAKDVLNTFLDARLAKNENKAKAFLTEVSVLELQDGKFELSSIASSFEIKSVTSLDNDAFIFQVAFLDSRDLIVNLELIEMVKILGEYYINSIKIAG